MSATASTLSAICREFLGWDRPALPEAARHRIAALTYALAADLPQRIETIAVSYAIDVKAKRSELGMVPLPELLAQPAFGILAQWLKEKRADLSDLQAQIARFFEASRQFHVSKEQKPE